MPRVVAGLGRVYTLDGHEVDQVIGSASLTAGDNGKFPRINGRTELIGSGICLAVTDLRGN